MIQTMVADNALSRQWWLAQAAAAGLMALTLAAAASARADIIDEVWVGGYEHNIDNHAGLKEAGTQEIEFEVDTARPQVLRFLGAPRIAVTMAFNTGGKTDFGGVALAWDHRIFRGLFGSFQFGLNGNDGDTRAPQGPTGDSLRAERLQLGSNVLFRLAGGLSWRFSRHWEVGGQYIHESNGQILAHGPNESLNELGARLGYRFR